jgi:2-dehydropantoate 2-reductase
MRPGGAATDLGTTARASVAAGRLPQLPIAAVASPGEAERYDLVLVAVRRDQLPGTLPLLPGHPEVLFFGNAVGRTAELTAALGERTLFGFPAAGGVRDGPVIRYVLIRQQKTMLGDPAGATAARLARLRTVFRGAGFPTRVSADVECWLVAHAAFVVPIAFALYRVGGDAARLADNPATVRWMVRATGQAFRCDSMSRSSDRLRSPGEGPRQTRPTTPGDHHAEVPVFAHVVGIPVEEALLAAPARW